MKKRCKTGLVLFLLIGFIVVSLQPMAGASWVALSNEEFIHNLQTSESVVLVEVKEAKEHVFADGTSVANSLTGTLQDITLDIRKTIYGKEVPAGELKMVDYIDAGKKGDTLVLSLLPLAKENREFMPERGDGLPDNKYVLGSYILRVNEKGHVVWYDQEFGTLEAFTKQMNTLVVPEKLPKLTWQGQNVMGVSVKKSATIYKEARLKSKISMNVAKGDNLLQWGKTVKKNGQTWAKVLLGNETIGYILASALDKKTVTINNDASYYAVVKDSFVYDQAGKKQTNAVLRKGTMAAVVSRVEINGKEYRRIRGNKEKDSFVPEKSIQLPESVPLELERRNP